MTVPCELRSPTRYLLRTMFEELCSADEVMRVDKEDFVGLVMISLGVEFMELLEKII